MCTLARQQKKPRCRPFKRSQAAQLPSGDRNRTLSSTCSARHVVHNGNVELLLNIVWVVTSVILLGIAFQGVRRGRVKLPLASAIMLTVVLCFILLPIISISDDLLEAQPALPLSGQTWRLASEGFTSGLNKQVSVESSFRLVVHGMLNMRVSHIVQTDTRTLAERLARSQRLRPPPFAV